MTRLVRSSRISANCEMISRPSKEGTEGMGRPTGGSIIVSVSDIEKLSRVITASTTLVWT